jgi:hypothetical protein
MGSVRTGRPISRIRSRKALLRMLRPNLPIVPATGLRSGGPMVVPAGNLSYCLLPIKPPWLALPYEE